MLLFHSPDVAKTKHHLSHHWDICKGVPMLSAAPRPGIGGTAIAQPDGPPHQLPSLYPPYEGPMLPPWLAYDKQVLCFSGYFKESLHEVYQSPFQVRPVKVYFYLEDGTIQVSEVKRDNSGLPQGCVVSRQRVPRPAPCNNEFLSILDLNVSQTVTIFSRVYQLTDCDLFTRHFLNRAGVSVPDPIPMPEDPGLALRNKTNAARFPKKPSIMVDTLGQFLRNDRKVLCFNAYWDDRESMFGDLRELKIYYFLADDTIQIKEIFPRNSGRDAPPKFLARRRIPKCYDGLPAMGQMAPYTVLNVLGGGLSTGRFVPDSLNCGDRPIEYYSDRDLTIGGVLNLYGREVHITDCDGFTREYYRVKYGLEDFTPAEKPAATAAPCVSVAMADRVLPVFNGWGSHEDSEGNCRKTIPDPPKGNFPKFLKYDRINLRFGAKLRSKIPDYLERIFIVTFYMANDEISVYELGVRNSGFPGGDFFKRQKFVWPKAKWFTSERPKRYEAKHFYIGAEIVLRNFHFCLVTCDEFGLSYMEQHPHEFVLSDVNAILGKIREALRPKYKDFIAEYLGCLLEAENERGQKVTVASYDTVRKMLIDLLGDDITDHEIVSLVRHFASEQRDTGPVCDRETVRAIVHGELNRNLWDDMDRLREHLYHLDPLQKAHMDPVCLRSAILACRLPMMPVLQENMFAVLKKNECGAIDVCDFLTFIDRIACRSTPIPPRQQYKEVCPTIPFTHAGRVIDWNCFIAKLGLEEALLKQTE